ncbi:MAG TPA: LEA type 2 family protein [Ferruginibacter sp.]|nr:LEA type 2 family protein [Ferruginibacter sp.]
MNTRPPLLIVVIIMAILASCSSPKDLEFKEYNNLKLDKVGFSTSTLKMNLQYYNPNNFGMDLKRTELDIYIDSTFLGHTSQELQVFIPKKEVFTIPIKVDLDMKNLFKNGLSTLFNKEVLVRAIGTIKVGKAGVYKNFKVDYSGKQQFSIF